ncbi:MFS transporter [candidate division KSB1 bacterium]|nr:MFS transporter [candidate division KSB1 bacterium]
MEKSATQNSKRSLSPWFWVPSLYFAEGIPYIVVMTISVIMYKRMGISNADIALYTSWLYLPWVIKPLWSPFVELFRTKRFWIVTMQLIIGAALASVALSIPVPKYFQLTLAFFWLLAFSSATHDIAADGFYMLGLTQHQQAWFVGIRNTFYRFAMLTGQGLLVILAGYIESHSGLTNVELNVTAVQETTIGQFIPPDSLIIQPQEGELKLVCNPATLEIPIIPRQSQEVTRIIELAQEWNAGQIQTSAIEEPQKADLTSPSVEQKETSFKKFKNAIRKFFGQTQKPLASGQLVGNIGVIYFHLSKQPDSDKKIVVNFGRKSGDKSFNLIEGTRAEFDANTWDRPLMAVIQLDSKLKRPSSASFDATAGNIPLSWILTFFFMAGLFIIFAVYHRFILPHPPADVPRVSQNVRSFFKEFGNTFLLFFKKDKIGFALAFLLLYRLGESQLVKLASPFLLDGQEVGGLGLTTGQVGFAYGTFGLAMLTIGGLVGGFLVAKDGLKKWIWWMALAINVPDAVYIYLAHLQPDNFLIINICVGIEQLGYGFGFTAYTLYMIYASEGNYRTAHYAIATGFMALGMMIPGMISGGIQELIGYQNFFVWVLISTIPGIILIKFLPIDPEFGKKKE